jgi:vacuolar protein sorting-associated protein 13A/C
MKLVGSIELIGNPLSFFNRISTGVVDFIEKPIEGISKGPLELGLGIVEGATSLIKNTVAGTFYSINKVSSGISTQIIMLTMDEHYI